MSKYLFVYTLFLSLAFSEIAYSQCKHRSFITNPSDPKLLALNSRSDTIDILNYTINLNITNFVTKVISGNTVVKFTPKVNGVTTLDLDLLEFTVDSVKISNTTLTYSYNDTLLRLSLPSTHNIGDTSSVTVYYHGVPVADPTWGGFYYNGSYAFNMGVGFVANPHNYGRVWFPCFDNFVERSTYEFNITTNGGKVAYCNGLLTKDTTDALSNRTRTWKLSQEIPTYMANVAVAPYTEVKQQYIGINDTIPIVLAALAADTSNFKLSFANLDTALSTYENHYGPYLWDKVGYYLVPFTMGAMEHATSISYPRYAANGTLSNELLMAHELSHHWFGDLVTCETAADMWINEGMASYSEHLFNESVYGKTAYKNSIRTNHEWVLHYVHIRENGYRAVSGIPHQYTYGDHVYKKGADIAHTMRNYMGDSLFFVGIRSFLSANKFKHVNSASFMNAMTAATGINMSDFLNDWVLSPGFSHFSIDSFDVTPNGGNYDVDVYVKQKLTGATNLHSNVPLELTFYNAAWTTTVSAITMSGANYHTQITLPINPVYVGINLDEKINDATAPEMKTLKNTGQTNFTNARMEITVNAITDSAFIKVDHNYTAPDPYKVLKKYRLSPNRYWKVDGILPGVFDAGARIYFDGTQTMSGGGYLDKDLINVTEDSLVLLYRKNTADDWDIFNYYTKTTGGNKFDKYGYVVIDSLMLGEYVFAMRDITNSISNDITNEATILCTPNPANENIKFTILNYAAGNNYELELLDITGKNILHKENINTETTIDCKKYSEGIYLAKLTDLTNNTTTTLRLVVSH